MAKAQYALEPGGEKRLELSWGWNYNNLKVVLDGQEIGSVAKGKELKDGAAFKLPDGSELWITFRQGLFSGTGLEIMRNGKPLPNTLADPQSKLKGAYQLIFFIGGLSIFVGLLAVGGVQFVQDLGFSFLDLIIGMIFLGLGYLVKQRSLIALYIAIALYVLLSLLSFIAIATSGNGAGGSIGGSVVVRLIFLSGMYQGIGAINDLNNQEA